MGDGRFEGVTRRNTPDANLNDGGSEWVREDVSGRSASTRHGGPDMDFGKVVRVGGRWCTLAIVAG